jgi:hypothetical protein
MKKKCKRKRNRGLEKKTYRDTPFYFFIFFIFDCSPAFCEDEGETRGWARGGQWNRDRHGVCA